MTREGSPTRSLLSRDAASRIFVAAVVLVLVGIAYLPVIHAGFVWDDLTAFVENDWLVSGDQWQHYVLRDFHGWINYFRPLGVALFTAEARLFGSEPSPMHVVSLALHLAATGLVGSIVHHCTRVLTVGPWTALGWIGGCMLLYGLHPALTESVAWISSQFELLLVIFCLSAAWAAAAMPVGRLRTTAIGIGFFLAACSKETAVALPLLVLLLDWAIIRRRDNEHSISTSRRIFARRNASACLAMLVAGLGYLWFRHYGLGYLLVSAPMYGGDLSPLGDVQKSAWTWWSYLKLLVLPVQELNAVHSFGPESFETTRPTLLLLAGVSLGLIGWSAYLAIMRGTAAACVILAIVIALFPTLNIVPTGYSISVYHDRYVALALAMCCVMLPLVRWPRITIMRPRTISMVGYGTAAVWLASSLLTIRSTLPAWQDDESLWRETITNNATNEVVQYNLVAALVRGHKIADANAMIDRFNHSGHECIPCEIEVASFELDLGNHGRASEIIDRIAEASRISDDLDVRGRYYLVAGQLALETGQQKSAIQLLRAGIELLPDRVFARVLLAESLVAADRLSEAEVEAQHAVVAGGEATREMLEHWRLQLFTPQTAN